MQKFSYFLLLFFISTLSWSQLTQEQLEARKQKLQEEIQEKEIQLQSVKKKEKSVVKLLVIQGEKIGLKERLINNTEKQKKLLTNNIYLNQLAINKLKRELEILKADYSEMIVKSYKSRSEQSRAMFILSSENFLQAYKRAQYMKQYSSYRKIQGEEIVTKSRKLDTFNDKLDIQKTEKQKLIAQQEKEQAELEAAKKVQVQLVTAIQKDKKKIAADIKAKQKESKVIDNQIRKLVREAILEANRRAAEANRKANPTKIVTEAETKAIENSAVIILTPEAKIVSDNFKSNKGRLPWPVEKGTLYQGFGDKPHPVYKLLTVHNSGIDIETDEGSNARAVFGGVVTKVIVLTPVNRAVFVQHGDYFTVYQNLSSVSVSKGDRVSIKQPIGRIRTNGDSGKTILKFMVMQNTTPSNPSGWLSGR